MLVRNLAGNLLGNLFILEDSKSSILGVFGVMLLLNGITEELGGSLYCHNLATFCAQLALAQRVTLCA